MSVPLLSQDEFFRHLELQSVHKVRFTYRQALKERLRATTRKDSQSLPKPGVKRLNNGSPATVSTTSSSSSLSTPKKGDSADGDGSDKDASTASSSTGTATTTTPTKLLASPKSCRRIFGRASRRNLRDADQQQPQQGDAVPSVTGRMQSPSKHRLSSQALPSSTTASSSLFDAAEKLLKKELEEFEKARSARKRLQEAGEELPTLIQVRKCYWKAEEKAHGEKRYRAKLMVQRVRREADDDPGGGGSSTVAGRLPIPRGELALALEADLLRQRQQGSQTVGSRQPMLKVVYCKKEKGRRKGGRMMLLPARRCKLRFRQQQQQLQQQSSSSGGGSKASVSSTSSSTGPSDASQASESSPSSSVESFRCRVCDKRFTSKAGQSYHEEHAHRTCRRCGRVYHSLWKRDRQQQDVLCDQCQLRSRAPSSQHSSSSSSHRLWKKASDLDGLPSSGSNILRPQRTNAVVKKRPTLLPPKMLQKLPGQRPNATSSSPALVTPPAATDLFYFHQVLMGKRAHPTAAASGASPSQTQKPASKCPACAKTFPKRSKMIRHVMSVHADALHKVDLSTFVSSNPARYCRSNWEEEVET